LRTLLRAPRLDLTEPGRPGPQDPSAGRSRIRPPALRRRAPDHPGPSPAPRRHWQPRPGHRPQHGVLHTDDRAPRPGPAGAVVLGASPMEDASRLSDDRRLTGRRRPWVWSVGELTRVGLIVALGLTVLVGSTGAPRVAFGEDPAAELTAAFGRLGPPGTLWGR